MDTPETPEYILFGYLNDALPELVVRDLNVRPIPGRFAMNLPHGEYTLRWDDELLDWVVTPLPEIPESFREDLRERAMRAFEQGRQDGFAQAQEDKRLILEALRSVRPNDEEMGG